jgi:hypothetical protein
MVDTPHIVSGDIAGGNLLKSELPGEVFVWHDILYDGPRNPGWPDEEILKARAVFLEKATAGGLDRRRILETLHNQYRKLAEAATDKHIVLWFDPIGPSLGVVFYLLERDLIVFYFKLNKRMRLFGRS